MKVKMKLGALLPSLTTMNKDRIIELVRDVAKVRGIDPEELDVKRVTRIAEPKVVDGARTFSILATTRDMDRDREIVLPRGGMLDEWAKTGVFTKNHDYSQWAIAKSVWHGVDDYGIKMHPQAAPWEEGDRLWALAQFMNLTASIGFVPLDIMDKSHVDWSDTIRQFVKDFPEFKKNRDLLQRIHRRWLMLETAIATVPCNPNAVQDELAKALSAGTIKESDANLVCKALDLGEVQLIEKNEDPPKEPKKKEVKPVEPKPEPRSINAIAAPVKRHIKVVETPSGKTVEKIAQETLDIKRGMI